MGHPSKFQRLSRLGSITAATSLNGSQPNFARYLDVSWAGTLHIHFRGFLPRYGILPGAKLTLHPPSLALSYFGSVIARHLSSGCEPNFAALSTGRHLYLSGRQSRCPHSSLFYNSSYTVSHAHMRDNSNETQFRSRCSYNNKLEMWANAQRDGRPA